MLTAMIHGIDVVLHKKTQASTDAFNAPIYTDTEVTVHNVLVEPVSAEAIVNDTSLQGKHQVFILHIPKGDTNQWTDTVVEFFGLTFKTFGDVLMYQEDMLPLAWSKKVRCERFGEELQAPES